MLATATRNVSLMSWQVEELGKLASSDLGQKRLTQPSGHMGHMGHKRNRHELCISAGHEARAVSCDMHLHPWVWAQNC